MKKISRWISYCLLVVLLGSIFTSCGAKKGEELNKNEGTQQESVGITFPLKDPVSLKVWVVLTAKVRNVASSFGETEIAKELEKKTGVKVEYIHPLEGQEKEQVNLLIASRDLPDIFIGGIGFYGKDKALADGVIMELNELQDKYAPNLTKIYKQYPEFLPFVSTEAGKIYSVPQIKADTKITEGPIFRKDWLDELGLKAPTTIDEWYTVLTAFKEKKNAKAPLTGTKAHFINMTATNTVALVGAFGVVNGFFVENGKVVFGPADPRYKDYLATMAKWYKEGLLDKEFATLNAKLVDAKMTNGQSGAMLGLNGGNLQNYLTAMYGKGTAYDLVGVQYPSLKPGEPAKFLNIPSSVTQSGFITTTTKHPAEAMAWLDYGFSKEGMLLNNYGIEGTSYKVENGEPTRFREELLRPDGVDTTPNFVRAGVDVAPLPSIFENQPLFQQQKQAGEAWAKWRKEAVEANSRIQVNFMTAEESTREAAIMSEIKTYREEFVTKVIMGQESLEKFDSYVAQMKKMGLDEAAKINQDGYDRAIKKFPQLLKPVDSDIREFYK